MKGIKGSLIRGTQKIKQKMGKTDKTVDDEYEMVHNKTLSTEKQAQNFSKHVNQLIENYHAMSTTLSFLAEDMRDLYQSSDPNCKQRQMADQLTKIAERIEQNCVLKFVSSHDDTTPFFVIISSHKQTSWFVSKSFFQNLKLNFD